MGMFSRILTGAAIAACAALPAKALDIQEIESPGGITYWLVEEPAIPIVSLEMSFRGGARLDPEGKAGLARMVAGLLDEGAGEMDTAAFSAARDEISARFGFSANRDRFEVSANMLAENASQSAALLATALTAPRFEADPMARVRAQMLTSIAESETDPSDQAARQWYARAFPDHPYGRPAEGTKESVAAITQDDLFAAHKRLLTRANVTIAIVGAIDADAASAMVDSLMVGLPEGTPDNAPKATAAPPPGVHVIDIPVPQSAAVFGHKGIFRDDPDFFPAYVMNYMLGGGGFASRLTEEVRVKRGLAYGVYSYLAVTDGAALYLGGVQTANERMAESIEVIRAEWARMAAEGLTEEELERSKKYLTGAFALRFDSNAKIASYLVFIQEEDLGIDYYDRRNGLVEAVTLEDTKRAAARLLDPAALSIVVAGQPAGL